MESSASSGLVSLSLHDLNHLSNNVQSPALVGLSLGVSSLKRFLGDGVSTSTSPFKESPW